MEQRKRIPPAVGILFCVAGISAIRQGARMQSKPEIALTLLGWIFVLGSMVINVRYLIDNFKKARRKN